jgi:hypothetical protein
MRRIVVAGVGLFVLAFALPPVPAQGDKLDAKQIMGKLNKPEGLYYNIVKELREDDPNWDAAKKDVKEVARLGALLAKTDPPKGEKESWQALTKAYGENTKALETAVGKMDKTAAKAASEKIGKSCEACHMAHKK